LVKSFEVVTEVFVFTHLLPTNFFSNVNETISQNSSGKKTPFLTFNLLLYKILMSVLILYLVFRKSVCDQVLVIIITLFLFELICTDIFCNIFPNFRRIFFILYAKRVSNTLETGIK